MPLPALLRRTRPLGLALCLGLSATAIWGETPRPKPRPDPAGAQASAAGTVAGAYLAARAALAQNDFAAAVGLYQRALDLDPTNAALLDGAVATRLATGDIAGASAPARLLLDMGSKSQPAILASMASAVREGDYARVKADLSDGRSIGQMTDALVLAWAELGRGSMSDALAAFGALAKDSGMRGYAMYHKALALALSGDFEGAEKILSGPEVGPVRQTRRAVVARVEVLAQLDRRPEALEALNLAFPAGSDALMDDLRERLQSGAPVPFDIVTSPQDGVAEVLFDVATALSSQADDGYVLLFARTAAALRPTHVEAVMLSAQLLRQLDQPDLAGAAYALIGPESPSYVDAEIGRANAVLRAGRGDQAEQILETLAASHPADVGVVQSLADVQRRLGRFADAVATYDRALGLVSAPGPRDWAMYYARAISLSELDRWPEAERDFRKALELNPNQPQVLNYLGYSYVDRGENLDEALKMIQRAVMAAPDQGYIVDSLAWAYFRLGRFAEAVVPMERASQLEPVDAIVTDHLGDVYWKVGRKMEAKFQWRRALSFHPTEDEALRIRRKLDVGLDQLEEEEKAGLFPPPPAEDAPAEDPTAQPAAPTEAPASGNDG